MTPNVKTFFDKTSFSLTHLVSCPQTGKAALIDPVLGYEAASASIDHEGANKVLQYIQSNQLDLKWILETHVHADHISAAHWLREQTQRPIGISSGIAEVQNTFNRFFGLAESEEAKLSDFDHLLKHGKHLKLGECQIETIHTPGHTPSCCTYIVGDSAFVGDTLFMPDFGSARCDFPGGDARQLYRSIRKILALNDSTKLYMCHDYMPNGRDLAWQTTVGEQRRLNTHIHDEVSEEAFVKMRNERDRKLAVPKLILPALQINIRAGKLPEMINGQRYLKLPLNKLTEL